MGLIITCPDKLPNLQPVKATLCRLTIRSGQFATIPLNYFNGFSKLRYLSLDRGALKNVPPINALAKTINTLDLNRNKITNLHGDWLENMYGKLRKLFITNDRIFVVSSQIWKGIPNISSIIIYHNDITHIEDPVFEFPRKSIYMNLGGNPLDCTSHLTWIVSASCLSVLYACCNTPSCRKGMPLLSMSQFTACYLHELNSYSSN